MASRARWGRQRGFTESSGRNTSPHADCTLPVTVIRSAEDQARDEQRNRATDQLNQDSLAIQKALLRVSDRQLATAIASVIVSALGTGVAAWALLFLIRTYRETRRTALATLKAARAAVMSATTAVGVEIPRLILFHLDLANTGVATWTAALQNPPVDVSVKNYGRTPAFVISRSVEIFWGATLPAQPDCSEHAYDVEPETVV